MKFSCKTKDILRTIGVVGRAISGQQALPILNNILMQAEGKICTLSATNLEFSIISHFDAEIENEGSITVPAKAIQNFAQYSIDEDVVFESSEDSQLKCFSKKSKTVISGESVSEYPTISTIQKESQISVSGTDLMDVIYHTVFASAKTTTRPVLSGVYVRNAKNDLCLVATDSYRLSEYKITADSQGETNCIIPGRVLSEVMNIIGVKRGMQPGRLDDKKAGAEDTGPVVITLSPQQVEIVIGRTKVLSRLIDGTFPKYDQIIPDKCNTKVLLPLQELLTTVRRMHYFAKESNNNLTISVDENGILIKTQMTQAGRDEAQILVDVQGENNKIALSSSYLLDFLSRVPGEEVQMEIVDKMHPALFRVPKLPNFLHLIMPLRMSEEN